MIAIGRSRSLRCCSSALVALSLGCGVRGGLFKAGGHRPARERILHTVRIIAQFSAVTLHLGSASVLYETVSPHLCLAVFCPAVNKAGSSCLPTLIHLGRSHSQMESAASALQSLLAYNSSGAHWVVTKRSHFCPFSKTHAFDSYRGWRTMSLP